MSAVIGGVDHPMTRQTDDLWVVTVPVADLMDYRYRVVYPDGDGGTSEFVVAVGASLGFLFGLGSAGINWGYAGALLAGGVIAAPIAAWLVKHLAARVLGVAAGGLIILTNSKTLLEAVGVPGVGVAVAAAVIFVLWVSGIVWAVKQERLSNAAARADEAELETATA